MKLQQPIHYEYQYKVGPATWKVSLANGLLAVSGGLIVKSIQQGNMIKAEQILAQYSRVADAPPWFKTMVSKLQAILNGARDPALAADPDLSYDDAVELQLLLEDLGT